MNDVVKIYCENTDSELYVNMGTPLYQVISMLGIRETHPFLVSYVNNRFKELRYRIYSPATIRFVDITHSEGMKVYQRTLFFIFNKVIFDLYPSSKLSIEHAVAKGFYCEIDLGRELTQEDLDAIKGRIYEIIEQDIPILREKLLTSEVGKLYHNMNCKDKVESLQCIPRLYSTIYRLADIVGYFYGTLAMSTGCIHLFDLRLYQNGLYLAMPNRMKPSTFEHMINQEKMFEVFDEYKDWVDVLGVSTVGSIHSRIKEGRWSELIQIAEAFHEKKIGAIADNISSSERNKKIKIVLISGPSSSGKTTFSQRLGIHLSILGLTPVQISMDDYFVDRSKTPIDIDGDYDYESIYAINLELFNDHLRRLIAGESITCPQYDFVSGTSHAGSKKLKLDSRSILIVEGIHGLNPELTSGIDSELEYRIYVSALTSISMDRLSSISTTDNRLIRRIIRDYYTRGSSAESTLRRWASVRRGEDRSIFPYQENADVMFNSSLFYELSVLRRYVEPLLLGVPDTVPEYADARKLLKFLSNFASKSSQSIPSSSIIREFIGNGNFND